MQHAPALLLAAFVSLIPTLTQAAPTITQNPVAQTVDYGTTATFTGAATATTTPTYQWYHGTTALTNGSGVSGATTNTLTLTNVDFNDAGSYSFKATDGLGEATSTAATLTVQKRPGAIASGNLPSFVGVGYGGAVHAIQPLTDGSYLVGGDFNRVTISGVNTDRKGLVRILADGTLDTNFPTVNSAYKPSVRAIAVDSAGRIFISGDFTSVVTGGTETPRLRVARLTSSYALDTAFNTSTEGPDKIVHCLAPVGDGSVYIGGEFTTIGATAIRYMAKLNASGARDTGFTNSINTGTQDNNKSVNSIVRLSNGTLYVGSSVSFWGSSVLPGQPAGRLVKLAANGTRDFDFASPDIFTIINAIIALPDGSLFAGGNPVGSLKRYNGTTGADLGFTLPGHFIQLYSLARQSDGKLLSGSYGKLIRTDANLTVDTSFDIGTGFDNYIRVITTDSAGRIYIGGDFSTFNGQSRSRFIILNGGDLDSRTEPKASQTITFAEIADRTFIPGNTASNTVTVALPTSSSGLPVSTVVTSGPATLAGNKLTFTGAGDVVLTASQAGNDSFSSATVSQTITIAKASQTITFAALSNRTVGAAPFSLGAVASSNLPVSYQVLSGPATVSGNVLTLTGETGTVSLRASQSGNSDFLAAADVDQSFSVTSTPTTTTFTLTNLIQTYTGTPRAIGTSGGTGEPVITYTIGSVKSSTPPTNAGKYVVEAVIGGVKKAGSLVINKAPLVITADAKRKFAGQDNPVLTFTYSGFLGSDNAGNALTTAPVVATTATKTSPGGIYPIKPSGGTATNYAFSYVNADMTVESWAGQYEALLVDPGTSLPVGKLELTVLPSGTGFTGKFTTAKQTAAVPIKGTLNLNTAEETADATATSIVGTGSQAVEYVFTLSLPLDGDFTASVTRAVGTPAGDATEFGRTDEGKKLVFPTGKPPVAYAGTHTVIFAPDTSANALPRPKGYGSAIATIDPKGKLTLVGTLADGTKISASLYPDANAGYRLYLQPYKGRLDSYCAAWIELKNHPDLTGRGIIRASDMQSLYWAKAAPSPATKETNYKAGIPESACTILLDPWLPPASKPTPTTMPQRLALNGTGDMNVFYSGYPDSLNLQALPSLVSMSAAGKVNLPATNPTNPLAWKMTVTPATGAFAGSHTLLDGTKSVPVPFIGVMRQPPSTENAPVLIGAGFSTVPQLSGQTTGTTSAAIKLERP